MVSDKVFGTIRFILCFVLGVMWFLVAMLGTAILAIPQVVMYIHGSKKLPIDRFLDFMEALLDKMRKGFV